MAYAIFLTDDLLVAVAVLFFPPLRTYIDRGIFFLGCLSLREVCVCLCIVNVVDIISWALLAASAPDLLPIVQT